MRLVEAVVRDLVLAVRRLAASPGFTAVAVTSLALGIGVNTLMFSFISGVLLQPLPFPDADRLVQVTMARPDRPGPGGSIPPPMGFLLRDESTSFDAVGVLDYGRPMNLGGNADVPAERLDGHRISPEAFDALGIEPELGRYPTPEENLQGAVPTVVLSHDVWTRRFDADPRLIGQSVDLDGQPTTVIGVMPRAFELFDGERDAWVPFLFEPGAWQQSNHWLQSIGRLKPGITIEQATSELEHVSRAYMEQFPDRGEWAIRLEPLQDSLFGYASRTLLLLQVAVGVVLLISCANLAALVLTRATGRQRELAVRAALGQGRAGLVRLLLVESLVLALAGGAVALGLAALALPSLLAITPAWLPRLDTVGIDARVFLFCTAGCVVTGVVFGLIPALQASKPNILEALHESGARSGSSPRRILQLQGLVTIQVALAFVLLIGAALVFNTLVRLQQVDFGLDPSKLLSFDVALGREKYRSQGKDQVGGVTLIDYSPAAPQLFDRIHEQLLRLPGVDAGEGASSRPFAGMGGVQIRLEGKADGRPSFAGMIMTTPGYFQTLQIPILRGRDFSDADQANTPWVVVVNEAAAKAFWPDGDAMGQRMTFTFYPGDPEQVRQVIGVVADTKQFRTQEQAQPTVFALHRQQLVRQRASLEGWRLRMTYVLRTSGDPEALVPMVRSAIQRIDPTQPITEMATVDSYLSDQMQSQRFMASVFGLFAGVALLIAVVGIYGVTAHTVVQRYREFGVRRALGATTAHVIGLVLRRSALVLALGVAFGIGTAVFTARFIQNYLWNVTPTDSVTYATVGLVLIATGLVACLVPGRRATRIDPLVALRHE